MSGIYLHIPFCRQACHYCNFHFSVSRRHRKGFAEALVKEIFLQKDFFASLTHGNDPLETLYFGGGTPSLLSADELNAIMESLRQNFSFRSDAEITLEANPDDLDREKLDTLKELGVNRLSIGIQSFSQADLTYMNRSHTSGQALLVLQQAQDAGFSNITADLIYGTPGLDDGTWTENILKLIRMDIPHISAYSLTVEKKTPLDIFIRKGMAAPVDEEQSARQFEILCEITHANGYDHYEISNFGKPGFYSRHNLSYWSGKPYLGLGPSAHSFIPGKRRWNIASTSGYMESILKNSRIPCEEELLTPDQQYNEYVMTALRTMWGADKEYVRKEFGDQRLKRMLAEAEKHLKTGMLADTGSHIVIASAGKFLADGIASDLFA